MAIMPVERSVEDTIPTVACRWPKHRLFCMEQKPAQRIGTGQAPADWSFPRQYRATIQNRFLPKTFIVPMMLLATLALPMAAHAQGTLRGAQEGAREGAHDAGPVGATVGAVAGTVGGILGVDDRPRFREYVVHERHPSYRYDNDFRVGAMLPESGVTYYDVPAEYHVTGYRYTYVNDHAVLVDPRTHRIVQIID